MKPGFAMLRFESVIVGSNGETKKEWLAASATSREGTDFATKVVVLRDETLSPPDGTEPQVGQQPPDEPEVRREAPSRVELQPPL